MLRHQFLQSLAQTSPSPLMLEISHASGCTLTDTNGKEYLDMISGISVSNVGHRHPKIIEAIHKQCELYLHLMVYGEYVQSPQVLLAEASTEVLPNTLNTCYFTNSGTEAIEGSMKLAKRVTGKPRFAAFYRSYHGHTQGAMSLMGSEYFTASYAPLLPCIDFLHFNKQEEIRKITSDTAAIFIELVKAENGCIPIDPNFLAAIIKKCKDTGTLIILDENQTGFGRTGSLFAFQQFDFVPDILVLGKGMGGGMPIGAFIANHEHMMQLSHNPVLGHITTFGGHPVCCAAALANLQLIANEINLNEIKLKEALICEQLKHPLIKAVHGLGLLLAIEFESEQINQQIIKHCIEQGVITDWFLFAPNMLRLAPPLTCTNDNITYTCRTIINSCNKILI
ncbi:MAG: aspartate aminotransferase family protein [Bacteroidetes bacterium]|nr:aspartate aminotransferase family protein [Bacteroidota bacterium]